MIDNKAQCHSKWLMNSFVYCFKRKKLVRNFKTKPWPPPKPKPINQKRLRSVCSNNPYWKLYWALQDYFATYKIIKIIISDDNNNNRDNESSVNLKTTIHHSLPVGFMVTLYINFVKLFLIRTKLSFMSMMMVLLLLLLMMMMIMTITQMSYNICTGQSNHKTRSTLNK